MANKVALKGESFSSFMEHFIALFSQRNYYKSGFFLLPENGNALNYISLMHKIHLLITVAQLNVCPRVLLDVRGIVRVFEVFVQLLGLKLAL